AQHRAQLPAIGGHDAGGILAAVLQHGQCVIELLVDWSASDDACNAAHVDSAISRFAQAGRADARPPPRAEGLPAASPPAPVWNAATSLHCRVSRSAPI